MKLDCPFNDENTLSEIVDSTGYQKKVADKIQAYKNTLDDTQKKAFNEIDDLMIGLSTMIQHNTIRHLYCPLCSKRSPECLL